MSFQDVANNARQTALQGLETVQHATQVVTSPSAGMLEVAAANKVAVFADSA
jgi:hypothetical protein